MQAVELTQDTPWSSLRMPGLGLALTDHTEGADSAGKASTTLTLISPPTTRQIAKTDDQIGLVDSGGQSAVLR